MIGARGGDYFHDVGRPQRTSPLGWIVVAVDRREALGQGIHIGDGDAGSQT